MIRIHDKVTGRVYDIDCPSKGHDDAHKQIAKAALENNKVINFGVLIAEPLWLPPCPIQFPAAYVPG